MYNQMKRILKKGAGLQVTILLLGFFAVLLFWGVIYQSKVGVEIGAERFFGSYFIWVLDSIPLPGLRFLLVLSAIHLVLALWYRIPRRWASLGLYLMHFSLLILILGGLLGDVSRRPLKGYGVIDGKTKAVFESAEDAFEVVLDDSLTFPLPPWGDLASFQLGLYKFEIIKSCEYGYPLTEVQDEHLILKNATGFQGFECKEKNESALVRFPGIVLHVKHKEWRHKEKILLGLNERRSYVLTGGETLRLSNQKEKMPFAIKVLAANNEGADVLILENGEENPRRIALNVPFKSNHYTVYFSSVLGVFDNQNVVLFKARKDVLDFIPYLFMGLMFSGFILHYFGRRERKKS